MKVLIVGATGMLGHKLMQGLSSRHLVLGTIRERENPYAELKGFNLFTDVNVENLDSIENVINKECPDIVINCVGIIKQLEESKNALTTIKINALLPHQMAELCDKVNAKLIHISTDCVFSGKANRPYLESDPSDADDLYGKSKFLGELNSNKHLTLRTSLIGPELRGKKSLVEWVFSQKGRQVKGYRNALFTGLTTLEISRVILKIIESNIDLCGVYHLSANEISKFDLVSLINERYDLNIDIVEESQFKCDRRLNSDRFRAATGYNPPEWREMIREMSEDII